MFGDVVGVFLSDLREYLPYRDRGHRPVSNDQPSIRDVYSTVRAGGPSRPVSGMPCRKLGQSCTDDVLDTRQKVT